MTANRPPSNRDDPWAGHPAWRQVQRVITLLHVGSTLYWFITILAYSAVFGHVSFSIAVFCPHPCNTCCWVI